jgi:hypothetical protein
VRDSLEVEVDAVINIRRLAAVDLAFLGPLRMASWLDTQAKHRQAKLAAKVIQ